MIQILQNLSNGVISLADIPAPSLTQGKVLINTKYSLISKGTEQMLLEFGKANYLGKARQQPDKVKAVINVLAEDFSHITTWDVNVIKP